ncbi:DegT/DnrJ/EryC1/StrS family aminotransferase [Flavitalea sp. BT771]|uniref:DegT/DnrJ/EryC1/StrS family aminotransferase n=1 Tax=Flavitalea sp. BT771 TaxID=3063329 RepID=UPI0026E275A0|nr:DegT/DnrJ/EryC1/StrS family aminotransferase [Flavitalea sp. BT771]MDO6433429.1 DegT/DnrJ/EryC1/StrS family aminotransferase [Flavitalea sp. BT771]MDV6222666.1 DegT/DnrJ/EryC1/StrS family aminotransferase [Flavitalea sp. BT771]
MPGFELFGPEERKEVNDVLETGIYMRYGFDGPRKGIWKSKELEAAICETFGVKYAQLTSSGTSALSTALAILGIGFGDEVIMPTFTFVASFEAVLSVGAIPVLVDVDETLTLDPASVRRAITPRTKCVMPVHMCGSMADLDALQAICKEHQLILLEDACQSIGAQYKGKALGTIGHAGTFSFDFVKTITCAEGGAVLTNSEDLYIKADGYTDHGHDHAGVDRGADLHPFIGYNYRISELHAAVGLAQIRKLDKFLAIQKKNHQQLKAILSTVPEITFRQIPDPAGDSCTFLSWFLPTEAITRSLVAELKEQGILPGNFYWFDNNWHYYRKWTHLHQGASLNRLNDEQQAALKRLSPEAFPVSDRVIGRCISTAISLAWTEEQLKEKGEKIVAAVKKVLSREKAAV